jgi:CHRD domain-containing protein
VQVSARLTAAQESPPQQVRNLKASGTFRATVRPGKNGYRLVWKLTFARLTGVATSADVHHGARGAHGAAVLHLCSPCKSGATGAEYFSPPELTLARQGLLYVNVRTARNPAGEIRGQLRFSSDA